MVTAICAGAMEMLDSSSPEVAAAKRMDVNRNIAHSFRCRS
jgi:hypothetical protein